MHVQVRPAQLTVKLPWDSAPSAEWRSNFMLNGWVCISNLYMVNYYVIMANHVFDAFMFIIKIKCHLKLQVCCMLRYFTYAISKDQGCGKHIYIPF